MTSENFEYSQEGLWAQQPMIPRRKVVLTSIGMITPSGNDTESSWQNIIAGKAALAALDRDQIYRLASLARSTVVE